MLGFMVSVLLIVLLTVLILWCINYLAQGTIPETPRRVIVVLVVLVAIVAVIYSFRSPIIPL